VFPIIGTGMDKEKLQSILEGMGHWIPAGIPFPSSGRRPRKKKVKASPTISAVLKPARALPVSNTPQASVLEHFAGRKEIHFRELKGAVCFEAIKGFVAEKLGASFNRENKTRCLFHKEAHPSFSIETRKNDGEVRFRCFSNSCRLNKAGLEVSSLDFYEVFYRKKHWNLERVAREFMKYVGLPLDLKVLPDKQPFTDDEEAGPIVKGAKAEGVPEQALHDVQAYHDILMNGKGSEEKNAREYLFVERGVSEEMAEVMIIGYCPSYMPRHSGHLTFPIFDVDRKLQGLATRAVGKPGFGKAWRNTTWTQADKSLYGINLSAEHIAKTGVVTLLEGGIDFLNFFDYAEVYRNCAATLTNNVSTEQLRILLALGVKRVNLLYDSDVGFGTIEKVAQDIQSMADIKVMHVRLNPGEADPSDLFCWKFLDKSFDAYIADRDCLQGNDRLYRMTPVGRDFYGSELAQPRLEVSIEALSPHLRYGSGNGPQRLQSVIKEMRRGWIVDYEEIKGQPAREGVVCLPIRMVELDMIHKLGSAYLLWLRLYIAQAQEGRIIEYNDTDVADLMGSSRKTISGYKKVLVGSGLLVIDGKPGRTGKVRWVIKGSPRVEK